jgi:hypothetical protein
LRNIRGSNESSYSNYCQTSFSTQEPHPPQPAWSSDLQASHTRKGFETWSQFGTYTLAVTAECRSLKHLWMLFLAC